MNMLILGIPLLLVKCRLSSLAVHTAGCWLDSFHDAILTYIISSYHVPAAIQKHVDYITPGVDLRAPKWMAPGRSDLKKRDAARQHDPIKMVKMPARVDQTNLSTCDVAITPACIRALYNVPLNNNTAQPGNEIGIFEDGDFYAQEDLDLFFANFTPYIPQGTHPTLDSVDGGVAPVPVSEAGGESSLDFQLAYPIIWPQQATLFQTDDINYSNGNLSRVGIYNDWLDAIDGVRCRSSYHIHF